MVGGRIELMQQYTLTQQSSVERLRLILRHLNDIHDSE